PAGARGRHTEARQLERDVTRAAPALDEQPEDQAHDRRRLLVHDQAAEPARVGAIPEGIGPAGHQAALGLFEATTLRPLADDRALVLRDGALELVEHRAGRRGL